jgi:phage tail-like protein
MSGEKQDAIWPLPKFYFQVDIPGVGPASFQEVSGLNVEAQIIEYRHGDNKEFSTIKMPGLKKVGNVTMKKGIFVKDNKFFEWFSKISMNTIERKNVTIKLLDEGGKPTMTWVLNNAWPTKITSTDLKSNGNDVAVESIDIAYETLTIENK